MRSEDYPELALLTFVGILVGICILINLFFRGVMFMFKKLWFLRYMWKNPLFWLGILIITFIGALTYLYQFEVEEVEEIIVEFVIEKPDCDWYPQAITVKGHLFDLEICVEKGRISRALYSGERLVITEIFTVDWEFFNSLRKGAETLPDIEARIRRQMFREYM